MPTRSATTDFPAQRKAATKYYERWQQMRDAGQRPVILSRAENRSEWRAWLSWYRLHGLWGLAELMADGRGEHCVPCLDPEAFDPVPADRRFKDD